MSSRYHKAHFLTSVQDYLQLPPDEGLEVAFAGRSNAGKSSALNAFARQKALARISKTPGRTQLINFFEVEPARYLVDLPGYGYAQVPVAVRRHWQQLLERYLNNRRALQGLFLLMDIRHPLSELDLRMLEWCQPRELPIHILLTKADKLKRGAALTTLRKVQQTLRPVYPQAEAQLFSALTYVGLDQAYQQLDSWLGYTGDEVI